MKLREKAGRLVMMVFALGTLAACMKDIDFDQVNDLTLTPEVETGLVYVDTLTTCDMLDRPGTEIKLCSLIPYETISMAELDKLIADTGVDVTGIGHVNMDEKVKFNLFSEPYVIDHLEEAFLVFEVASTFDAGGSLSLEMTNEAGEDLKHFTITLEPSENGREYIGRDTLEYPPAEIDQLKKVDRMQIRINIDELEELDKTAYIRLRSMASFQLKANVGKRE